MNMPGCSLWEGISLGVGTKADYEAVARWHYRAGRPIGVTRVLVARFHGGPENVPAEIEKQKSGSEHVIGVLVEARPVLNCSLRNVALPGRYAGGDKRACAARLNAEVRSIARVVIEPRFRGIGLAAALVGRCLETAVVPRVEALASMGRAQRFFEQAGMGRYDRPMPAESVRLVAALQAEGLTAGELLDLAAGGVSRFLAAELVRFWRSGRHPRGGHGVRSPRKCGGTEEGLLALAIADARRRVLSWPAYYLWQNPAVALPPPVAPREPAEMPEALTVFLPAGEKRRILSALRQTHPDAAVALTRWAENSHEETKDAKTPGVAEPQPRRRKLATNEHE